MRIKSNWHKEGRVHTPQEISDALAFTVSRIADNALKNTRKADFEIEVGPQYLDFLAEFLVFLILVADRIAYRDLSAEDRASFTGNLANRVAETYAENRSRLLEDDLKGCKQRFIDLINQRAGEYADFGYDEKGPEYGFYRYLAFCISNVLSEEDAKWVIDPMISFEAPEAVQMVEKTLRGLYEVEPKKPRRRAAMGGD
ncbi:MAG: hypothetical protein KJ795_08050 [Gammaproteobacteria bacterium]|nr:hypothetical protein [Gammaproteobacteria bacterium]MBU1777571.1 hypothetical protein [Gammaproteobacteria bacterium]MBU1969941.1 hypothetical protein [Gammaproteobacteria bacterium]